MENKREQLLEIINNHLIPDHIVECEESCGTIYFSTEDETFALSLTQVEDEEHD